MALNKYSVSVFFPEVKPAHNAEQRVTVEAGDIGTASRRGYDEIRERDGVKGKRITTAKITVALIDSD